MVLPLIFALCTMHSDIWSSDAVVLGILFSSTMHIDNFLTSYPQDPRWCSSVGSSMTCLTGRCCHLQTDLLTHPSTLVYCAYTEFGDHYSVPIGTVIARCPWLPHGRSGEHIGLQWYGRKTIIWLGNGPCCVLKFSIWLKLNLARSCGGTSGHFRRFVQLPYAHSKIRTLSIL